MADPSFDAHALAAFPADVRALVEGQQAAERVWALHAAHGSVGGSEGLRRLLLAIIRDLRVVFILLALQLVRMRAAIRSPAAEQRALAHLCVDIHDHRRGRDRGDGLAHPEPAPASAAEPYTAASG